jgi:hypothetical protein
VRVRVHLGVVTAALLVAFASSSGAFAPSDVAAELRALDARCEAARAEQGRRYAAAKSDAELAEIARDAPWSALLAEYERLAVEHAKEDVAVVAWAHALDVVAWGGEPEFAVRALDALERDHLSSLRLAEAIQGLAGLTWRIGTNRYEVFLRRAAQETPHRAVRGFALWSLAESLGSVSERVLAPEARVAGESPTAAIDAEELARRKTEAKRLLSLVLTDFADTPPPSDGLPKDWVRRRAEGLLFELEHLQLGMVAPDFEAIDERGERWKLSDYRGRVVLLDFWGHW